MANDQFNACEKTDRPTIPPGGMAIIVVPGECDDTHTYFDVALYHNFAHAAKDLTKEEKTIFLITQGLIDIATKNGASVLERGHMVMERFVKSLGVELDDKNRDFSLENMIPKGRA